MTKVTYTNHDGTSTSIDGNAGDSIMRTAVRNGFTGIVAECGGVLSCATCHVFVPAEEADLYTPITQSEDAMLDGTAVDREPASRLSCQLVLPEVDEVHVGVPEYQD
ncbi:2Fe-2S iron-sulfur cluster-binding protein [Arthrobacter sp. TMT4-20]